jgi:hypothetical protein
MPLHPSLRNYNIRKGFKGQDPLVDTIIDNPEGPEAKLYLQAKDIHESKVRKKYMEACLLTSNDFGQISELLGIPQNLVEMYAKIFYDVYDLDTLSKLELLEKPRERDEVILKTWALHQGLGFIAWRLGKVGSKFDLAPQESLQDLFNMCLYKAKEALFNPNSSAASAEATKWTKLSTDIARLLKLWVLDSAAAKKDLELAIKEVVPEFRSLDDLAAEGTKSPDEILGDVEILNPDLGSLDDLNGQD